MATRLLLSTASTSRARAPLPPTLWNVLLQHYVCRGSGKSGSGIHIRTAAEEGREESTLHNYPRYIYVDISSPDNNPIESLYSINVLDKELKIYLLSPAVHQNKWSWKLIWSGTQHSEESTSKTEDILDSGEQRSSAWLQLGHFPQDCGLLTIQHQNWLLCHESWVMRSWQAWRRTAPGSSVLVTCDIAGNYLVIASSFGAWIVPGTWHYTFFYTEIQLVSFQQATLPGLSSIYQLLKVISMYHFCKFLVAQAPASPLTLNHSLKTSKHQRFISKMVKELQNNISVFCYCSLPRLPRQGPWSQSIYSMNKKIHSGIRNFNLGTEWVTGPGAHLQLASWVSI